MSRILVVIEGGLVQGVWSDDPTVQAVVIDYDLDEHEEDGATVANPARNEPVIEWDELAPDVARLVADTFAEREPAL